MQAQDQTHTAQFLRKRKFLIFFPLIAVPLFSLLIWATVIGRNSEEVSKTTPNGLNTRLPGPDMGGRLPGDKLSLYIKAEKDSIERARLMGDDTLVDRFGPGDLSMPLYDGDKEQATSPHRAATTPRGISSAGIATPQDPNEARIRERLDFLNKELTKATNPTAQKDTDLPGQPPSNATLAQLEMMMQQLPAGASGDQTDAQMQQVNEVLGRILDVQHPELVKARLQESSLKNKEKVYQVSNHLDQNVVETMNTFFPSRHPRKLTNTIDTSGRPPIDSLRGSAAAAPSKFPTPNNFYELDGGPPTQPEGNAVTAVVHGSQLLLPGATLTMRLTQDIYVQGILIPAGTQIHGKTQLDGERLNMDITAIRYGEGRYPVKLSVYDYDGLPGIRIRDAISRQSASTGADQALQSLQMYSLDPSLGAQAATAGMETVKSLLNKKIKLVKFTVKADYPVLLIDNNGDR